MNHCNCYLQGPGSNIVDFTIKLTLGVGKGRLVSHMRFFDSQDVALQLFVRNTEDLFAIALTPPFPTLAWWKTFFAPSSPDCISCGVEDFFFCSLSHWWQHFSRSTFPQVALLMKILPTLRLPSSKSSIHNNDLHM